LNVKRLACTLLVDVSSSQSVNRLLFWFKKTVLFVQSGFFSSLVFWIDALWRAAVGYGFTLIFALLRTSLKTHTPPPPSKALFVGGKAQPTQRPNSKGAKYQERSTGRGGAGVRTREVLSKAKMSKSEYQRRLFQYGANETPSQTNTEPLLPRQLLQINC
jgi:hypothetical protein